MNRIGSDNNALSDSSNDGEANTAIDATEHYALLNQDDAKSSDIILRRIANYANGSGSRFQRKFRDDHDDSDYDVDDEDDDEDSHQHRQFNVSLRHPHKKPFKQFLYLFGFATALIILSQLYLLFYYDDPNVPGE